MKYDLIYTDPPWKQTKNLRKVRPNQTRELDYITMKTDEIADLHRQILENNVAEVHNIFMWTIDKYLIEAEKMMEDFGYVRHARLIWDKENDMAPAYTVRFSHEYLLWFYKKGNMYMPSKDVRGRYTTVMREPSKKHSQKPECAYEMLETMFPEAKKLELFARTPRPGWDSVGNELEDVV